MLQYVAFQLHLFHTPLKRGRIFISICNKDVYILFPLFSTDYFKKQTLHFGLIIATFFLLSIKPGRHSHSA